MGSLSDIVINAIYQLWHLIPIVVVIVLFKKYMDNKDRKNRVNENEKNEEKGLTLELRTIKKYKDIGYKIEDDKKDQGIDLVCTKDDKILLIQCKNSSKAKSITHKDIKAFHSNAMKYARVNNIKNEDITFRYVIPFKDVLHKSAVKILMDDSYNCKYVLL